MRRRPSASERCQAIGPRPPASEPASRTSTCSRARSPIQARASIGAAAAAALERLLPLVPLAGLLVSVSCRRARPSLSPIGNFFRPRRPSAWLHNSVGSGFSAAPGGSAGACRHLGLALRAKPSPLRLASFGRLRTRHRHAWPACPRRRPSPGRVHVRFGVGRVRAGRRSSYRRPASSPSRGASVRLGRLVARTPVQKHDQHHGPCRPPCRGRRHGPARLATGRRRSRRGSPRQDRGQGREQDASATSSQALLAAT